jgi:hypothetical protein
MRIEI